MTYKLVSSYELTYKSIKLIVAHFHGGVK